MDRHRTFMGMKDVLDHMGDCHEQWQYADRRSEIYLIESMKRDLNQIRRLCESLADEAAATYSRDPQVAA